MGMITKRGFSKLDLGRLKSKAPTTLLVKKNLNMDLLKILFIFSRNRKQK
tara:strand:- start:595 stop:744 length:150 start_codon:yes stop_codon:yes gene_type:complete